MNETSFDKIAYLSQSTEENTLQTMTLNYGASEERVKQVYEHNGMRQEKIFVDGIYEKVMENEKDIKEKYYIYTPNGLTAVRITHNNNSSICYVIKDHIGSVNTLVATNGSVAQETYVDACLTAGALAKAEGFPRDSRTFEPLQYSVEGLISYGYTGHDHWDSFGLIYMKGRVYDPALGRFLSPDNYVQNAGDLQSYNRYTYCNNNPLKYTDPDGELAWFVPMIIGGVIGGIQGYMIGKSAGLQGLELAFATLGGAGVGALSGLVAGAFVQGGGVMAYTTSIAVGSHFNSIGMMAVGEASGAEVPYSFSVGPASYSLSSQGGEIGYLGKPGNTTMENIGYGLGALANLQDAFAAFNTTVVDEYGNKTRRDSEIVVKARKEIAGHSWIEGDGINISVGPAESVKEYLNDLPEGKINNLKWETQYLFKTVKGRNFMTPYKPEETFSTTLNNVNVGKLQRMTNYLNRGLSLSGKHSLNYGVWNGCVNQTSRALFRAGVFNVNAFLPITSPVLLNAELALRNYGMMFSYYMTLYR